MKNCFTISKGWYIYSKNTTEKRVVKKLIFIPNCTKIYTTKKYKV